MREEEMKINHEPKLERFLNELKKLPEVIGVLYLGSTATKEWDEYSDLDIDIVVEDKNYNEFLKKIPNLLKWWGEEKLINKYMEEDEQYLFVNKEYLKIEIDPKKKNEILPNYWFKFNRIVYDKTGFLKREYEKSLKIKKPKLKHKEFIQFLIDARGTFIYVVRHYSRGQRLSGISELGNIGGKLFYYLGMIKGYEGWEHIRNADKTLDEKEWNFLKNSKCNSFEKKELIRSIKPNWEYMKNIEDLYEMKTKRKLNLKCNDKEILEVIWRTLKVK